MSKMRSVYSGLVKLVSDPAFQILGAITVVTVNVLAFWIFCDQAAVAGIGIALLVAYVALQAFHLLVSVGLLPRDTGEDGRGGDRHARR